MYLTAGHSVHHTSLSLSFSCMGIGRICLLKVFGGERQTAAHVEFCSECSASLRTTAYTDNARSFEQQLPRVTNKTYCNYYVADKTTK